ncbi:BREX-1 system phosphatase PglZ type A, partial [Myxococcota bacterium]|nr:BREX-1 system phosphatase PglZ type A [Myxococcota bacterium]
MKAPQINQALHQKFITEGERLVFWHDPKGEFSDYLTQELPSELEAVTVLDLAKRGGLSTKLLLEQEDTTGKYLLYSTGEQPVADEDWLLDIRIYSAEFHADVALIWLEELGLSGLYLREHLKTRSVFLGSQERRKKLKVLIESGDDEAQIDLKMMAVLAGSEVANFFSVLRAICHGHLSEGRFELSEEPGVLGLFEKMSLSDRFWDWAEQEFSYAPEAPSIAGLLRSLFVTELFYQINGFGIDALAHFELPQAGRQNAVVYLTQWRDSSAKAASYDAASEAVAAELKLSDHIGELSFESILDVFTFWAIERRLVALLRTRVLEEVQTVDVAAIIEVAKKRKAGYWLSG